MLTGEDDQYRCYQSESGMRVVDNIKVFNLLVLFQVIGVKDSPDLPVIGDGFPFLTRFNILQNSGLPS